MKQVKPLISIVTGHDQKAPGALAVAPLSKTEYQYATELSIQIVEALQPDYRCHVVFRDGLGLTKAYAELQKYKPDLNIELHFNSHSNPEAYGTEVLCELDDMWYAKVLQHQLCKRLGRDQAGDRGVKALHQSENGYFSVTALNCPSLIMEPFFGSSKEDARIGLESQAQIAQAVRTSAMIWFPPDYLRQSVPHRSRLS